MKGCNCFLGHFSYFSSLYLIKSLFICNLSLNSSCIFGKLQAFEYELFWLFKMASLCSYSTHHLTQFQALFYFILLESYSWACLFDLVVIPIQQKYPISTIPYFSSSYSLPRFPLWLRGKRQVPNCLSFPNQSFYFIVTIHMVKANLSSALGFRWTSLIIFWFALLMCYCWGFVLFYYLRIQGTRFCS